MPDNNDVGRTRIERPFRSVDWQDQALCQGRVSLFFIERNSDNRSQDLLPAERKALRTPGIPYVPASERSQAGQLGTAARVGTSTRCWTRPWGVCSVCAWYAALSRLQGPKA